MKIIKKIMIITLAFVLSLFFVIYNKDRITKTVVADSTYQEQTREYRAVWISHFAGDLSAYKDEASYKASINTILNNVEAMNMNAIVFHVRTHNNAFYKSTLNPKSRYYANVDFDEFDPLEWIIDECHKRGIEFHAWLNPYRISTSGNNPDYTYESLPAANAANNPDNLLTVGNNIILDPGRPAVRDFIVDTCMELIENYDVDAIDFDDYFYISGCDDSATRAIYNTKNLSVGDFRREQVNLLIKALHDNIQDYNLKNNKAVEIGISPSGVYRNGSYSTDTPTYDENGTLTYPLWSNTSGFAHYDNYLYSDTKYWIDNEWIDYITPQSYHAIKQKSSSFVNLTEWWSWCVRNKKVNLSMGIGIYMALESGSSGQNWKDYDELANQMLDANQYDEIHGLCFYKYSSLLNSGDLMQAHRETLARNWKHFIPSAVKPQHTNLDEPIVSNITFVNNTLSWSACENVRGYVVWRVAPGEIVDQNNINHFYQYTTKTSLNVPDDGHYYYVSSVNLANEFSMPLSYQQDDLIYQAETLINQITFPVTVDQKGLFDNIQNILKIMNSDAINSISNLNIYYTAYNMYLETEAIEVVAKEFEASLAKDVEDIYLLPLKYGDYEVSWELKNGTDYYDLATGAKKVAYLATTKVNLRYTLSKDGLNYSANYALNVGYTKQSETALFYRNTPHALNSEEDPTSTGSYIGWSGKVLKFTIGDIHYVFFIAAGNYHELTSSEIPDNHWSSCGDFYLNLSGSTITSTGASFDVNTTANYGYFIIGANGVVKTAVDQASGSSSITLKNGEALYCVKYLDGLINDSVMKPATKLAGVQTELLTPNITKEITLARRIESVENEISNITYPVTLTEKAHILRIDSLIKGLGEDAINATLLAQFKQAMNELNILINENAEIDNYRLLKTELVANYLDLANYRDTQISVINSLISAFQASVQNAITKSAIDDLVASYLNQLDQVKTKAQEDQDIIEEYRASAIVEISSILDSLDEYSQTNQALINRLHDEYVSLINAQNVTDDVDNLKVEVLAKYRNIATLIDETIATYMDRYNSLVAEFDYDLYESADKTAIRALFQTYKAKIQNGKTADEVANAYAELIEKLDSFQTIQDKANQLSNYKIAKCHEFEALVNLDYYYKENRETVLSIIDATKALINSASTEAKIDEIFESKKLELAEVAQDLYAKYRISSIATLDQTFAYIKDTLDSEFLAKAEKVLDDSIVAIDEATTFEEIVDITDTALAEFDKILSDSGYQPPVDNPTKSSCFGVVVMPIIAMLSLSIIFIKRKH